MEQLIKIAQQDSNILNAFMYGSRVYGTNHQDSDYDFICVLEHKEQDNPLAQFGDVTNYSVDEFQELVNQHEISVLECLFLPTEFVLKQNQTFSFSLNKSKLRESISAKSSNSWVKCKKKFLVEEDYNPYVGKKSAWHSLRILDFGKQIADHQKIIDFSTSNHFLLDIMQMNSWEELNDKYKPIYNGVASSFKQSAPKETSMSLKK